MTSARAIADALGGGRAQRIGNGFLVPCPVPSHGKGRGDKSPSLHVSDDGSRIRVHCYAGCDSRDIIDELKHRGLLDGAPATNMRKPNRPDDHERRQHNKARWLWRHRQPISNTIAETYLREARKITCPLPGTLAFLPAHNARPPAMIAAFGLPGNPCTSVHLTLLKPDGSGKADVTPNKITVGRSTGLPIVIGPPDDLTGHLAVTEGIEDALTLRVAMPGLGAWAAGSAGRMPALAATIPGSVKRVTIYGHDDKAGRDGARKLADALCRRGIEVFINGITL